MVFFQLGFLFFYLVYPHTFLFILFIPCFPPATTIFFLLYYSISFSVLHPITLHFPHFHRFSSTSLFFHLINSHFLHFHLFSSPFLFFHILLPIWSIYNYTLAFHLYSSCHLLLLRPCHLPPSVLPHQETGNRRTADLCLDSGCFFLPRPANHLSPASLSLSRLDILTLPASAILIMQPSLAC